MTDRELMQQALDALEHSHANEPIWKTPHREAITALRQALGEVNPAEIHTCTPKEQEPFAEVRLNMTGGNAGLSTHIVQLVAGYYPAGTKLYTAPPQREWQGLTDEELENELWPVTLTEVVRLVEAKLKEKNHD